MTYVATTCQQFFWSRVHEFDSFVGQLATYYNGQAYFKNISLVVSYMCNI